MRIHGLVSFYDEPIDNIARCLTGLRRAGVSHVVALDGAYALYPNGEPASNAEQHAAFILGCRQLGMACTLHVPSTVWDGNEVQKRTALFAHAWAAADEGDWFLVVDADEFVTEVPDDLPERLAATDRQVGEVQAVDMIAVRLQRRDMPPVFPVRKLFRAQPIHLETSHLTYVTADGRYLWGDGSKALEPTVDLTGLVVEHHPDRRPLERQQRKLGYYNIRDEKRIERGVCELCGDPADRLVAVRWKMHPVLGCPVGEWMEACAEHATAAEKVSRLEFEALGIDPDSVKVENRLGRPPAVAA